VRPVQPHPRSVDPKMVVRLITYQPNPPHPTHHPNHRRALRRSRRPRPPASPPTGDTPTSSPEASQIRWSLATRKSWVQAQETLMNMVDVPG